MKRFLFHYLAIALAWGAPTTSFASVYQCKAASGAVIFSDQPCDKGATGGEIKVKPASGAVPPLANGQDASARARTPMHERTEAALTPACRALRLRMENAATDLSASEAEIEGLMNRYATKCLPLVRAAQQEVETKQNREAEAANQRSACDAKRKVVVERRARWQGLSEAERNMVVLVEKEVANECR